MAAEPADQYNNIDHRQPIHADGPYIVPFADSPRPSERLNMPTRSSTVSSPSDLDRHKHQHANDYYAAHARSEDLNHGFISPLLSDNNVPGAYYSPPPLSSSSRLANSSTASATSNSATSRRRNSSSSATSNHSESSNPGGMGPPASTAHTSTTSMSTTSCSACGKPMQGAFVRALGAVYHLNCFKCMDCGTVVASKFFPIDGPDGKQYPLCERDYFRRLNLICGKCSMALRGSYITACNKKYHVEHFTCSICPTLFGPQDSYYEHDGDVYCHYHYSTRFATKCAGCSSAILKQFVEINRNMRDECWHPECYMINKFWNVKVVTRRPNSAALQDADADPPYVEEEAQETASSLKEKQIKMEQEVYRIWTVLSAFEESSAACISDMLRQVSNGQYLEAIRMADRFILHVEVLFGTIDDLEHYFAQNTTKGMSHVREARMLCRKTVDLFTLLSHTQETGARRMGMTQELLALVTGLAHYLKILIRIALTGALKLERDYDLQEAMASFLDKLHMLAIQGSNPSAKRMIKGTNGEILASSRSSSGNISTQGVTYGFRSLAPEYAGESPFSAAPRDPSLANVPVGNPPSDLCVKCNQTVEEDCVRLGTYQRWHSNCVQCATCKKIATVPLPKDSSTSSNQEDRETSSKPSTQRRPPALVGLFLYEVDSTKDSAAFGQVPSVVFCTDHGHSGCRGGFQSVSRLEQYSFLLNVALRRLYTLLKKRGVVPASHAESPTSPTKGGEHDPYRNSGDIHRLKSVHLDRKLSATAQLPKRSTIVESPTGRIAQASNVHAQRSQEFGNAVAPKPMNAQVVGPSNVNPSRSRQSPGQQNMPQISSSLPLPQQQRLQRSLTSPFETQLDPHKPPFGKSNSEVMIVDDSAPNSPAVGMDDPLSHVAPEEGITLADIPQLVEVAQARAQHRSLPRESAIPYIAELSALELAIVKHAAAVILHRSPLKDYLDMDEILELLELKKGGFWNKLFKGGNLDKKNVKKKGVFGVPLELLVEREGSDSLHGASRIPLRVPSFMDDVVSAMRQMDMSVEGIFRKNGNIRRLKELTDSIDKDPSSVDLTLDNPVQLAALLKKFLRELPDPLLTFKLHRLLIATQGFPNEEDRNRMLHMVSLLLPKPNRDTMEVLFVFLKWVASFTHMDEETGNKMDLPNLATVICPSILYSRGRDAVRDESFGAIRLVTAMLENQDVYYTVPEEFMPMLQDQEYFVSCMELPSKDFMKKCEIYMRLKASGRPPLPPISPMSVGAGFNPSSSMGNLTVGRTGDNSAFGSRSPMERMGSSPPGEGFVRNGHRQQSPQRPHYGHSQHPQNGPPPTLSQGIASIHSPQPRPPNLIPQFDDYSLPRPQPIPAASSPRSSSRPNSYVHPRSGEEGSPGTPRLQ